MVTTKKPASSICCLRRTVNILPDGSPPSNTNRPQRIQNIEAVAEKRRFLDATRRDLYAKFLAGMSEYSLTESLGGRSQRVCRLDVEAAIRETAREERRARLAAERQQQRRVA